MTPLTNILRTKIFNSSLDEAGKLAKTEGNRMAFRIAKERFINYGSRYDEKTGFYLAQSIPQENISSQKTSFMSLRSTYIGTVIVNPDEREPVPTITDIREFLTNKNMYDNNKGTFLVVASPTIDEQIYSGLLIERSSNSTWSLNKNDQDSLYGAYCEYIKRANDNLNANDTARFLARFGRYNNTFDFPPLLSCFMEERGVSSRIRQFLIER